MKQKKVATIALVAAMAIGTLGFSIPAKADGSTTDYVLTIPAKLTVENVEWNDAGGITAKTSGTFDSSQKLTVTAASGNGWKLQSGTNAVGYNLAITGDNSSAYDSNATAASWEFAASEITTSGTKQGMGIIVEDYSEKPAGTYQDTVTFTAKVENAVKEETLLTTLTFGGSSTYSETTSGVVSVTARNVSAYNPQYGWLWFDEGSLSVTAKEGYTITKCVFIQNAKTPITDTKAPFEIHFSDGCCTEDTNWDMDGVTSIEVYGYAN